MAKQTLLQRLMHGAPGVWAKIVASSEIVDAARALVRARREMEEKAGIVAAQCIAHGPAYAKLERAVAKLDELETDEAKAAQEIIRRAER